MTGSREAEIIYEPERYELAERPAYQFELARRDFLKGLGGGIFIVIAIRGVLAQDESGGGRRGPRGRELPQEIGAWLHIGEDGLVTAYTGKVEVGQDIRTSLSQVVAEELRTPLASVRMVMGDTELTPFDAGTFGSRTTPTMAPQLRKAAAAARDCCIDLAAEQMKVERASLVVADGQNHAPADQAIARASDELSKGQKLTKTIGEGVSTTPARQMECRRQVHAQSRWPRQSSPGEHRYTSDMKRPGMLHGKVLRPAAFGATLASVDVKAAEAMPGVTVVRDGELRRRRCAEPGISLARAGGDQGRVEDHAAAIGEETLRLLQEARG